MLLYSLDLLEEFVDLAVFCLLFVVDPAASVGDTEGVEKITVRFGGDDVALFSVLRGGNIRLSCPYERTRNVEFALV